MYLNIFFWNLCQINIRNWATHYWHTLKQVSEFYDRDIFYCFMYKMKEIASFIREKRNSPTISWEIHVKETVFHNQPHHIFCSKYILKKSKIYFYREAFLFLLLFRHFFQSVSPRRQLLNQHTFYKEREKKKVLLLLSNKSLIFLEMSC